MNRNQQSVFAACRAIDVGHFNIKYTLGRKQAGSSAPIAVGLFPALAPTLANKEMFNTPGAERPDGIALEVDGVHFFVGNAVRSNSTGADARLVTEDYALSRKYLAMTRGAFHYMLLDAGSPSELVVGHLVLGLPLTTYLRHRSALAERMRGEHVIEGLDGQQKVTVEQAIVVPQPQGALWNFGSTHGGRLKGLTLVIDVGGGTVDWFVSEKAQANIQRSGAHPRAMLACASAVANAIDARWASQSTIIERIDVAIREQAASFRVQGRDYELAPFLNVVESVLQESLDRMLVKLDGTGDLECILLTGGGAKVYEPFLKRKQPELAELIEIDDHPVYSNVRGFHIIGERLQNRAS